MLRLLALVDTAGAYGPVVEAVVLLACLPILTSTVTITRDSTNLMFLLKESPGVPEPARDVCVHICSHNTAAFPVRGMYSNSWWSDPNYRMKALLSR